MEKRCGARLLEAAWESGALELEGEQQDGKRCVPDEVRCICQIQHMRSRAESLIIPTGRLQTLKRGKEEWLGSQSRLGP
jgi:hypothetical protein